MRSWPEYWTAHIKRKEGTTHHRKQNPLKYVLSAKWDSIKSYDGAKVLLW